MVVSNVSQEQWKEEMLSRNQSTSEWILVLSLLLICEDVAK